MYDAASHRPGIVQNSKGCVSRSRVRLSANVRFMTGVASAMPFVGRGQAPSLTQGGLASPERLLSMPDNTAVWLLPKGGGFEMGPAPYTPPGGNEIGEWGHTPVFGGVNCIATNGPPRPTK